MPGVGGSPDLSPAYMVVLFLMVVRTSSLLLATPILGSRTVPAMSKVGIAVVLSLLLLPLAAPHAVVPETFGDLLLAIGKELVVGLLAGFAVTLVYASLQLVASLAGVQMGFGFSNLADATYAGQTPVLDYLFTGIATLIFFTGNFHHQFLIGIQRLFEIVPPNSLSLFRMSPEGLVGLSANMFLVALRVALPLLGALVLTDLALGIMARTAPQMNMFFVGMPAKIAIGIFAIMVMLPFVVNRIEVLFSNVVNDMVLILR